MRKVIKCIPEGHEDKDRGEDYNDYDDDYDRYEDDLSELVSEPFGIGKPKILVKLTNFAEELRESPSKLAQYNQYLHKLILRYYTFRRTVKLQMLQFFVRYHAEIFAFIRYYNETGETKI